MNASTFHPDWIEPQWPAPARVRAVVTTRAGGCSAGIFESMNLGDHVGDAPDGVARNRALLTRRLGARPVFMKQVHASHVERLEAATHDGVVADGAVSTQAGLAAVVMVADCLPVLLAHESVPAVAALHAGWRGLAGEGGAHPGIIESGLAQMEVATGLPQAELRSGLLAWLGPCIGPRVFEVGPEVREAFTVTQAEAHTCFEQAPGGKYLADLPQLARLRLQRLGITRIYGNDGSDAWCTVTQSRFFSHRRVSGRVGAALGDTGGRMAACIWLD